MSLLIAQGVAVGLLLALLLITGNALFLITFGATTLPYVYIAVAFLGAIVSSSFATLQKRWTLPQVAMATTAAAALFFFLCWLALALASIRWIPFALVTAFPLLVQVAFIILGAQAGRLLDVGQIKRLFPWVVTGFIIGFIAGGAIAPMLIAGLDGTANVLPAIGLVSLMWLALVFATGRSFPVAFLAVESTGNLQRPKSMRQLLSKRFVALIFIYQMLAAMVTQLGDFMVLAQAGERYSESEALAQFFSRFTILLNTSDLFFALLIAGVFLRRFGLRAGLLANPVASAVLFAATTAAGAAGGQHTVLFFGLVVTARVANITLTDGTSRTAVNAVYQPLPASERFLAQTGAEGVGAPLALGITGIVLLLFNAVGGLTILPVLILTLLVSLLWVAIGLRLYRAYTATLLDTIRRRTLGEVEQALDATAAMVAVEKLLERDEPSAISLALDTMETAGLPSLDVYLCQLLADPRPTVRTDVLARIERRQTAAAAPQVAGLIHAESDPAVRAAAVRALCALQESEAVEQILPLLRDAELELRRSALVGLLRYGGIDGVLTAGGQLASLEQAVQAAERSLAAEVIGEVGTRNFYRPLLSLLHDEEPLVRRAALVAAGQVRHPKLLPGVIDGLVKMATRSAAMSALYAFGEAIFPHVDAALRHGQPNTAKQLVRVCGQIRGDGVIALLQAHLEHTDRETRQAILKALNLCRYRADTETMPAIRRQLRDEVAYAAVVLQARQDLGEAEAVAPLQRALKDELRLTRERAFLLLSFIYGPRAMLRAEARLDGGSGAERALTLEFLQVTLAVEEKALLLPLVMPRFSDAQRAQELGKLFRIPALPLEARLQEMIADEGGVWVQPWLRACAIFAAGRLGCVDCVPAINRALEYDSAIVQETARWALGVLGQTSSVLEKTDA